MDPSSPKNSTKIKLNVKIFLSYFFCDISEDFIKSLDIPQISRVRIVKY